MADKVTTADPESPGFRGTWAKIVAKSWADPDFKQRVKSDPASVLKEYGLELPEGMKLEILDTPPSAGTVEQLSGEVRAVAAGVQSPSTSGWQLCAGTPATFGLCISGAAPGGMQPGGPSTSGWALCIGVPVTASLCVSGAAPGGMQPGGPSTSGWQLCAGTPATFGLCISGAAPGRPAGPPLVTGWDYCVGTPLTYGPGFGG